MNNVPANAGGALSNSETSLSIPREKYFAMCKDLNDEQRALNSLPSEKFDIKAKDSVKDTRRNTVSISVPDDKTVSQTKGLPKMLTVCVGARVMLTKNIDISDHLVNGASGIIVYPHFSKHSPLNGEIYVSVSIMILHLPLLK